MINIIIIHQFFIHPVATVQDNQ